MSEKMTMSEMAAAKRQRLLKQKKMVLKRQMIRRQTSGHSETNEMFQGNLQTDFSNSSFLEEHKEQKMMGRVLSFEENYFKQKPQKQDEKLPVNTLNKSAFPKTNFNVQKRQQPAELIKTSPTKKPEPVIKEEKKNEKLDVQEKDIIKSKKLEKNLETVEKCLEQPNIVDPQVFEETKIEKGLTRSEAQQLLRRRHQKRKKKTKPKAKENESKIVEEEEKGLKLNITDIPNFVVQPVEQKHGIIQCYIERNKIGTTKRLFPEYHLFLKEDDQFLLAAKKRAKNRTSNYVISLDSQDLHRHSSFCVGKVRANFLGTEFQIFDSGINPTKLKGYNKENLSEEGSGEENDVKRKELGVILYASNILGSRGPRKMRVAVPSVKVNLKSNNKNSKNLDHTLLKRFKKKETENIMELLNKPPRWNDEVGAYVLNFNGRVTMASVKNFQLVLAEDEDQVVLQFGRVGKELFTMDFAWPLTPLQAFGICLSSFDGKIACE